MPKKGFKSRAKNGKLYTLMSCSVKGIKASSRKTTLVLPKIFIKVLYCTKQTKYLLPLFKKDELNTSAFSMSQAEEHQHRPQN